MRTGEMSASGSSFQDTWVGWSSKFLHPRSFTMTITTVTETHCMSDKLRADFYKYPLHLLRQVGLKLYRTIELYRKP